MLGIAGTLDDVKTKNKRIGALVDAVERNEKIAAFLEQFAKNVQDAQENDKSEYKYAGKFVPGDL